jgi:hypothetical protein
VPVCAADFLAKQVRKDRDHFMVRLPTIGTEPGKRKLNDIGLTTRLIFLNAAT